MLEKTRGILDALRLLPKAESNGYVSVLEDLLRWLTHATDSYCCILWKAAPEYQDSEAAALYTLAHWMPQPSQYTFASMPISESATGQAITSKRQLYVPSVTDASILYRHTHFWDMYDITHFVITPIAFSDGMVGAINVYRQRGQPQYTDQERTYIEYASVVVCSCYVAARDASSLALLKSVSDVLQNAGDYSVASRDVELSLANAFSSVCGTAASVMACEEVSLFLGRSETKSAECKLQASTLGRRIAKTHYRSSRTDGVTGLVLETARPFMILDLGALNRSDHPLRLAYPGLVWTNGAAFLRPARDSESDNGARTTPPLCFMAAPVSAGKRQYGVLRCCLRTRSPYFFDGHDLGLLGEVAQRIAYFWEAILHGAAIHRENTSWRNVMDALKEMNRALYAEVARDSVSDTRLCRNELRAMERVIPGADVLDVRLCSDDRSVLRFAATYGNAWSVGGKEAAITRTQRVYPITTGGRGSIGDHVVHSKRAYHLEDPAADQYYDNSIPGLKECVSAPVGFDEILGVLDVGRTGNIPFPNNVMSIVEILGQQMQVHIELARIIGQRKVVQKQQAQMYEDLAHQLRNPINSAVVRARWVTLQVDPTDDEAMYNAVALRGLCGKAMRVIRNIGVFRELAAGRGLTMVDPVRIGVDGFRKILSEAIADVEGTLDVEDHLSIELDCREVDGDDKVFTIADRNFVDQAIMCVLDNAVKYSEAGTCVLVALRRSGDGGLMICVTNKGVHLREEDIDKCRQRGWQGEEAREVLTEGSGIGLWIVDNVMRAQHGRLNICPTSDLGMTTVELHFPRKR